MVYVSLSTDRKEHICGKGKHTLYKIAVIKSVQVETADIFELCITQKSEPAMAWLRSHKLIMIS